MIFSTADDRTCSFFSVVAILDRTFGSFNFFVAARRIRSVPSDCAISANRTGSVRFSTADSCTSGSRSLRATRASRLWLLILRTALMRLY